MKKFLLILSTIVFLTASIQAGEATKESVTKLYVATFDRAPDRAGLEYWLYDSGLSLEQIASSFFEQPETKELYPDGYGDYDFILAIYKNLFAREPDSAGGEYWQKELASGSISKSIFILAIVNGAKGDDASILDNKTQVGLKFVEDGLEDTNFAKDVLQNITSNKQTMVDSFNKISNITIDGDGNIVVSNGSYVQGDNNHISGDTTNNDNSQHVTNNIDNSVTNNITNNEYNTNYYLDKSGNMQSKVPDVRSMSVYLYDAKTAKVVTSHFSPTRGISKSNTFS